jgi:hypothetical protein
MVTAWIHNCQLCSMHTPGPENHASCELLERATTRQHSDQIGGNPDNNGKTLVLNGEHTVAPASLLITLHCQRLQRQLAARDHYRPERAASHGIAEQSTQQAHLQSLALDNYKSTNASDENTHRACMVWLSEQPRGLSGGWRTGSAIPFRPRSPTHEKGD